MATLRVTVVGQDIFKVVAEKFELAGINKVNQVNTGMLGNLKTLTYAVEIADIDILEYRKKLSEEMRKDNMRLMPMFADGDWMRMFVFKPFRTGKEV